MSEHLFETMVWLHEKSFNCEVKYHVDPDGHITLNKVVLMQEKSCNGGLWYDSQGRARYTKAFDYLSIPLQWINEKSIINDIKQHLGVK